MKRLQFALGRLLVLGALQGAGGCALFQSNGPSTVAEGQYFSTGHPDFDEFFVTLYRLQVQLVGAPHLRAQAETELAERLALPRGTRGETLMQNVHERAQDYKERGIQWRVLTETAPEGGASFAAHVRSQPVSLDGPSQAFRTGLERATRNLLQAEAHMASIRQSIEILQVRCMKLEAEVPLAFQSRGHAFQATVHKNLRDSQKLLALMQARSSQAAEDARLAFSALANAVNSTDSPPQKTLARDTSEARREIESVTKVQEPKLAVKAAAPVSRPPTRSKSVAAGGATGQTRDFEP